MIILKYIFFPHRGIKDGYYYKDHFFQSSEVSDKDFLILEYDNNFIQIPRVV